MPPFDRFLPILHDFLPALPSPDPSSIRRSSHEVLVCANTLSTASARKRSASRKMMITETSGSALTIGYWKNWSSCTRGRQYIKATQEGMLDKTLDYYLSGVNGNPPIYPIGDITGTPPLTCAQAVSLLNKSPINSTKKAASDPAYSLAAQFLAARLNYASGATQCPAATTAIASAQTLLDNINFTGTGNYKNMSAANKALANSLAATLDSYNNNTLCPVVP